MQSKRTFTYSNGNSIDFSFDSRNQWLYNLITNFNMSRAGFKRNLISETDILYTNAFKSDEIEIPAFYVAVVVGNVNALNGILDKMYRTITINQSMVAGAVDLALLFKQDEALAALMKHPLLFIQWDIFGIEDVPYSKLVKMPENERLALFGGDEKLIEVYSRFDRVYKQNCDPKKELKFLLQNVCGCVTSFAGLVLVFSCLAGEFSQIIFSFFSADVQTGNNIQNQILYSNNLTIHSLI